MIKKDLEVFLKVAIQKISEKFKKNILRYVIFFYKCISPWLLSQNFMNKEPIIWRYLRLKFLLKK